MTRRKQDGAATLVAVAVVAFFVGRYSVDLSTPPAPIASPRLFAAPTADVGPVYYANCSEARAAGAAPIREGEPGYAPHLDRDGDGVACE
jgi:hypothetical protein